MALGLATIFVINACQTPEERAKEMNTQPVTENADANNNPEAAAVDTTTTLQADESMMSADSNTATSPAASVPPRQDDVVLKKKPLKGRASVDMKAAPASGAKVEVMPSFPGGESSLNKFVEDNLQYPQQAIDNDVEGRVIVTFDVDENGRIYRPNVVSDKLGYGLEEEALRVIKSMPQWNPGKLKGKNVKTTFTLPIVYQLI